MPESGHTRPSTRLPQLWRSGPIAEIAPRLPYSRGTELGRQGQPCTDLYIIEAGYVLLTRHAEGGEEHALYLLGPGDLFGEGSLAPMRRWVVSARAVTDGAAHVLPAAQFPRMAQYYPQLTAHVATLLSSRLERAHRRLDVVAESTARERLLALLRVMADYLGQQHGDRVWLPLRITQSDLADMAGLARETVARTLGELESEGLVRRRGRQGLWLQAAALAVQTCIGLLPELPGLCALGTAAPG